MAEEMAEEVEQAADTPETPEVGTSESAPVVSKEGRNGRKSRVGVVTSDKCDKTVTVQVERQFAHPLYTKQVRQTKKYHAHDENNECREGDVVRIGETRPLSKTKRWRVLERIERGG